VQRSGPWLAGLRLRGPALTFAVACPEAPRPVCAAASTLPAATRSELAPYVEDVHELVKCIGLDAGEPGERMLEREDREQHDPDRDRQARDHQPLGPCIPRAESLRNINDALKRIAKNLKHTIHSVQVTEIVEDGKHVTKLLLRVSDAQIKVEPNINTRGTLFAVEERSLVPAAEKLFKRSTSINTVSLSDLYGGKIYAALDRQHPRDLFDVMLLLKNEGVTDDIRKGFIVYLASHDRPMSELIDPTRHDMQAAFENHFTGMTTDPVSYEQLIKAREELINTLRLTLTESEKKFLISIKEGKPIWSLLNVPGVEKLPGVQWKLLNIAKMDASKHKQALDALKRKLGL